MLGKGVLVISHEIELAWGVHPIRAYNRLSKDGKREREALKRLLSIYRNYNMSVTWAIVGHLFLDRCSGDHPISYTSNWFEDDPGTCLKDAPLWYGRDIVEEILSDPQNHEIASHSFSHVPFNHCSREVAEFEIGRCREIAKEFNIKLKSFIFPYNAPGHLDLLPKYGFETFRAEQLLFESKSNNNLIQMIYKKIVYDEKSPLHKYSNFLIHLAKYINLILNLYPIPISQPRKVLDDLHLIPMSRVLPLSEGLAMWDRLKIRETKNAIDLAVVKPGVLHLWCHLHDYKRERDIKNLETILQYADKKREGGKLLILPMCCVAEECRRIWEDNQEYDK